MTTDYAIRPIPRDVLAELRVRDDAGNPPMPVDSEGEPLRCCLRRNEAGEDIVLVSYAPLRRWAAEVGAEPGPYLELGPVFIHAGDCAGPDGGELSATMRGTRRVCRAYDAQGHIRGGLLVEAGRPEAVESIEEGLERLFAEPGTAVVHLRAVEYGCFQFEARRV